MLLWLVNHNLIHYLTFRSIMAALTALLIVLAVGPAMIRKLTQFKIGQHVRDDGPQSHLAKTGTPTMGGILMLLGITASIFIWADLTNRNIWILMATLWSFGAIGFVDDYKKLIQKNPKGLASRWKYFWQSVCGLIIACALYYTAQSPAETALIVPFFKDFSWPMGLLFIPFVYIVVVGSSNAVNLTDGLDGSSLTTSVEVRQAIDDLRQTGCLKASALILLTNDGCGLGREQLDQIRSSMGFSQVIILEKNARNVGLAFKLATRLKSDETIPS